MAITLISYESISCGSLLWFWMKLLICIICSVVQSDYFVIQLRSIKMLTISGLCHRIILNSILMLLK